MSLNLNTLLQSLEADAQIEKTASVATAKPAISAELAGVLEKKASEDITKKAFAEGEELARQLLAKVAADMGEMGAGVGAATNNINADNAAMIATDNKKILPNATGGTVEGVLQGTVDNAIASGATTDDRVNGKVKENNAIVPIGGGASTEKQESETNKEETMDKTASDSQLAKFIMEKLAQEFSPEVTTPAAAVSVAAAAVPNKIQVDNATMTAQHDAIVQGVVPGGDGTVNALFESIVAKAVAQGGQNDNLVLNGGHIESRQTQGVDDVPATGEAQEKAAAVSALCEAGMDFESAVDLVKQAEEALFEDAWEQEKQAAFGALIEHGIDFDQAVALVKQAEEDLIEQASAE